MSAVPCPGPSRWYTVHGQIGTPDPPHSRLRGSSESCKDTRAILCHQAKTTIWRGEKARQSAAVATLVCGAVCWLFKGQESLLEGDGAGAEEALEGWVGGIYAGEQPLTFCEGHYGSGA